MIFPASTLHYSAEFSGEIADQVLISADSENPITVLSFRIQQEKDSSWTEVSCDGHLIGINRAKDFPIDFPFHVCNDDVVLQKSGNDIAYVSIAYAPYNIHTATEQVVPTSQPFTLKASYTFGEITIALLLIPLLMISFYRTILQAFRKPIVFHK